MNALINSDSTDSDKGDIFVIANKTNKFVFVRKEKPTTVLKNYLLSVDNRTFAQRYFYTVDYIQVEKSEEVCKAVEGFRHNLIINGAPGTGKSHYITEATDEYFKTLIKASEKDTAKDSNLNSKIEDLRREYINRVTFYEDYSYENFVGCYKPVPASDEKNIKFGDKEGSIVGEAITYQFEPGPFID